MAPSFFCERLYMISLVLLPAEALCPWSRAFMLAEIWGGLKFLVTFSRSSVYSVMCTWLLAYESWIGVLLFYSIVAVRLAVVEEAKPTLNLEGVYSSKFCIFASLSSYFIEATCSRFIECLRIDDFVLFFFSAYSFDAWSRTYVILLYRKFCRSSISLRFWFNLLFTI